jgi:hypothetical protein
MATEAILMQAVIVQALSGGDHLKETLEQLRDGD